MNIMRSSMRQAETGKDFQKTALRLKTAKWQHAKRPTTHGACFLPLSSGRLAPRRVSACFICARGSNERVRSSTSYVGCISCGHNEIARLSMMRGI